LGNAFKFRKQLDFAASEYRTAIQLKPQLVLAHWNLVQTLMDQVLAGIGPVANARERADFAMLCDDKRLFATAVRFYEQAFSDEPGLADELARQHRYTAACSAALASDGKAEENEMHTLDDSERRRLCDAALDWLRAELMQYAKTLQNRDSSQRGIAISQLQHWLVDPDLAAVRDEKLVARMSQIEQGKWQELWEGIRKLLEESGGP
jgi:hypothetical protein